MSDKVSMNENGMSSPSDKRRLAAIVFTDIVGYTPIMERDEQLAMNLLKRKKEIVHPFVDSYGGKVLKEMGDGMLLMFDSTLQAVQCSIDIQKQMREEKEFSIRIGVHIGDVVIREDDIFGSGVNIASRIELLAPPGGICVSRDVWQHIKNQSNLMATPLGLKKLKGVSESVEIFELKYGTPLVVQKKEVSLFKDLLQRRFPQILGFYILGSLAIVQVMKFLANQYMFSPHLINFSFMTLFSMTPAISFLAYFHGKPGMNKWTKVEKIGILTNILVSGVFLFLFFAGKDLGAISKYVTLENEKGEKIKRVIPKAQFRKKVALFFFANESGDSTLDWLQYGISEMLMNDLIQDIFLRIEMGGEYIDKIKKAGFPDGIGLPLTLMRKIADESHLKYFVAGSFTKQDEQYSIKTSLYETRRTKLVAEKSFREDNIFKLIDKASVELKHDLGIPETHIEQLNDLPVAEMMTGSMDALRSYIQGVNMTYYFGNDWENAEEYFKQSVLEDPTFVLAHSNLSILYSVTNKGEEREEALRNVLKYLYKLPERFQLECKYNYYYFKLDGDKALAILKMTVELFPEDIDAHSNLAESYTDMGQLDDAISEYERILEIDPERDEYLQAFGYLYKQKGKFEKALNYYKQYADKFPNDANSFTEIGSVYKTLGDYEMAKSNYEKALLVKPDKVSILVRLANIQVRLGNFEEAIEQYQEALKLSKTSKERANVYSSLTWMYELKGQMEKSIEYMELELAECEDFKIPVNILFMRMNSLGKYVRAGKKDVAFQIMQDLERQWKPPWDKFLPIGYMAIYLELRDADNAEKSREIIESVLEATQLPSYQLFASLRRAKIIEMKSEYKEAVLYYQKYLEFEPTDVRVNLYIGRCYRKIKDFKNAKEHLEKALKILPFDPEAHYEIALLYWDMGEQKESLKHLEIALEIWKDADSNFKLANEAKEKLQEWKIAKSL